jgi:hypothetical protein
MKKLIKLSALSLLLGMGVCAGASAQPKHHKNDMSMNKQVVSLIPLKGSRGFAVRVDKLQPSISTVIVSDADGNNVFKDRLTEGANAEKKYVLSQDLPNGKYSVEVYSKGHDIKTDFYIYNNGKRRIVDIM